MILVVPYVHFSSVHCTLYTLCNVNMLVLYLQVAMNRICVLQYVHCRVLKETRNLQNEPLQILNGINSDLQTCIMLRWPIIYNCKHILTKSNDREIIYEPHEFMIRF